MDIYERRTLRYVNRLRKKAGYPRLEELRPGTLGSPWSCTIANSLRELDVQVNRSHILNGFNKPIRRHPFLVNMFIYRFDYGRYQHLRKVHAWEKQRMLEQLTPAEMLARGA